MSSPNPIKQNAKRKGEKFFLNDKPCKRGHFAPRRVDNGQCTECQKERYAKFYLENRDAEIERVKKNTEANQKRKREYNQKYRLHNLKTLQETIKIFHAKNPKRAVEYANKRRAAKLQRTPAWTDPEAIRTFYENCPEGMTVDHIIPLQGKIVSGLHVANNLQYLTSGDNSKKRNRFDPEQVC